MKNLKVSLKLIISFLIIIGLCLVIGAFGVFGTSSMDDSLHKMYYEQTRPLGDIGKAIEYKQRIQVQLRELALFVGDAQRLSQIENRKNEVTANFLDYTNNYSESIKDDETARIFDEAMDLYHTQYSPGMNRVLQNAKQGASRESLIAEIDALAPTSDRIIANFTECMDLKMDSAEKANYDGTNLFSTLLFAIIAVICISIVIALWLAFYISGLISKPLQLISRFMTKAGKTGAIALSPEDAKHMEEYRKIKDEVGECINGCAAFVHHINTIASELEYVANRDLSSDVEVLSDEDVMGLALQHTVSSLNNMFGDISTASSQVSVGANEVATGAHSLAQGSTEQAASVEQLSASVNEISEKTRHNAQMAGDAAEKSSTIRTNAEKGSLQMDNMMKAVNEINEASQNISKIIKTIDDIAFQTNILALNAAVEAARAGQHGKGFAVVAEEVRNLASKSAQAAKDTSAMIESSVEKSNLGLALATETAESLKGIVEGVNVSTDIIQKIADSSDEQTLAVSQINIGIDQVSQVIQQSSATAEQSAAASQQMSGQATLLRDLVQEFKLKENKKIII
ncbi:MAG: methyl-accepting chemotaxis protein [Oscillospiraceae bacterium]|nr:methyl-accepting chemotaxis protein [Oscillospiraceae bacterium]